MNALETMMAEVREEGRREGREEGRKEGREEGRKEGMKKGRIRGKIEGIELALELKFGEKSIGIMERIKEIESLEVLEKIAEFLKKSKTWEEFTQSIDRVLKENK